MLVRIVLFFCDFEFDEISMVSNIDIIKPLLKARNSYIIIYILIVK